MQAVWRLSLVTQSVHKTYFDWCSIAGTQNANPLKHSMDSTLWLGHHCQRVIYCETCTTTKLLVTGKSFQICTWMSYTLHVSARTTVVVQSLWFTLMLPIRLCRQLIESGLCFGSCNVLLHVLKLIIKSKPEDLTDRKSKKLHTDIWSCKVVCS